MIVTRGLGAPRRGSLVGYGYTSAAQIIVSAFRDIIRFTLRIGQNLGFDLER